MTIRTDWEATTKISVLLGYMRIGSSFTGETVPVTNQARADQYQTADLNITYAMRRWLSISPYALYQTRTSNTTFFQYNGAVVGVRLRVQWPVN